eukprot:COSAG01_NODE_53463_length_339_cov_0.641667_1_plen_45_part_10
MGGATARRASITSGVIPAAEVVTRWLPGQTSVLPFSGVIASTPKL